MVCETTSPFDRELSKMHDAEVHFFSESVTCMRKGTMKEPVIKLTNRWNDYLEQYKESARIIDGEQVQFIFHIHPDKQTNAIVREMDGWIRHGQGEDEQFFTLETCSHGVLFMGMMSEIPISSKEPKGGKPLFVPEVERNAA